MMQVLALDLSLTRTGVALPDGTAVTWHTSEMGVDRLRWFREMARATALAYDVGLVVIEGYSMGGQRGSAGVGQMLGELGGVIRLALSDLDISYVDVPPACLKKYATGKGNASKNEVLTAAVRRLHYGGADDNEADALWLQQMAWCHYYGVDAGLCVPMPQTHRDALLKVTWAPIIPPVSADGAA